MTLTFFCDTAGARLYRLLFPLDPPAAWRDGTRRMGNNSLSILPCPGLGAGDDIDLLSWEEIAVFRIGWRSVLRHQLRAEGEQLRNSAEDRRAGGRERQASCLPETPYRRDYCGRDSHYRIRLIGHSRRCPRRDNTNKGTVAASNLRSDQ